MTKELTIELTAFEFVALSALAEKSGISVETQAARIVEAHLDKGASTHAPEVSIEFLRQNVDAVLDAVERGPVRIREEGGRVFIIMSFKEYERLSETE